MILYRRMDATDFHLGNPALHVDRRHGFRTAAHLIEACSRRSRGAVLVIPYLGQVQITCPRKKVVVKWRMQNAQCNLIMMNLPPRHRSWSLQKTSCDSDPGRHYAISTTSSIHCCSTAQSSSNICCSDPAAISKKQFTNMWIGVSGNEKARPHCNEKYTPYDLRQNSSPH